MGPLSKLQIKHYVTCTCYEYVIPSPTTRILLIPTHMEMSLTDYCFRTTIIQMPEKLRFTQLTHSQSALVSKQKRYIVESNSTAH